MKRKVPNNTSTFTYYNANHKNKTTTDCVIRAICTAMKKPYLEVYKELYELSLKTGYMINERKCYEKYLKLNGWIKQSQPKKFDNTKYDGNEFINYLNHEKYLGGEPIIMKIGTHHLSCIVDNTIHDIWNCSYGKVGNWWVKE